MKFFQKKYIYIIERSAESAATEKNRYNIVHINLVSLSYIYIFIVYVSYIFH